MLIQDKYSTTNFHNKSFLPQVQRQLQLRIDAQGRYLHKIIEEQEETGHMNANFEEDRNNKPSPISPFKTTSKLSLGSRYIVEEGTLLCGSNHTSPESSHTFNNVNSASLVSTTTTFPDVIFMNGNTNSCDYQLPHVYHEPSYLMQINESHDQSARPQSFNMSHNCLKIENTYVDYGQITSSFHDPLSNDMWHNDGFYHHDDMHQMHQIS